MQSVSLFVRVCVQHDLCCALLLSQQTAALSLLCRCCCCCLSAALFLINDSVDFALVATKSAVPVYFL